MTSNLGSEYLLEESNDAIQKVNQLLHQTFKPEFLNRIDEIITFHPLHKDVQIKIVEKMLDDLKQRLAENEIEVQFSDRIKEYIIEQSFNYEFGARPIKRFIQKNIETFLAHSIIQNDLEPKKQYTLDYENDQCVLIQE